MAPNHTTCKGGRGQIYICHAGLQGEGAHLTHVKDTADVLRVLLIQQHQPACDTLFAGRPDARQQSLPLISGHEEALQRAITCIPCHCRPFSAWHTRAVSLMKSKTLRRHCHLPECTGISKTQAVTPLEMVADNKTKIQ